MGLLDDLLAGALRGQGMGQDMSQGMGMGRSAEPRPGGAGGGSGLNPTLMALLPIVLALLANRGGSRAGTAGGGLGDILGQALGGGPRQGGGLEDILGQALGGGSAGGLGGLLQKMEQAGFGDQARSWVGSGPNQSISTETIGQVFGRGGLSAIARQAGISETDAGAGLAQLLPELVNHVTPQGRVPDEDQLGSSLGDLMRRLGI
jgi:uncharacterized protein YidB (DUF937 family)